MAAGGPWSVKGIAPQAREAAKDAARREGKTLGEWLNEIILETGEEAAAPQGAMAAPADAASPSPTASFAASPAPGSREMLDALAQRLEAAEHRSTLAITGIDQSVRGLISRLEATERSTGDVAHLASESVTELHHAHSELARRLAALEADGTAEAGLEAVKTLEGAVAKVAGHVHDRDRKQTERAGELEDRLSELDTRFARTADDLARRVDAASDHAAMQAMRATNDLRTIVETGQARTTDALANLEATIGRINERLSAAESLTDNAMRSLEASFAHLDDRLRHTEAQTREHSAESVGQKLEQKFETLGRELRERIDQVRAETAQAVEHTAPRIDRLERALEKSNKRNARTLGKIGEQIGVLGQAVERRLEDSERRLREDAIQDRTLETRLRDVENSSAEAIRKVAESVEQISMRLAERIEASESRNTETVATLGREMAKLADRLTAPPAAKEEDTLAARLRESERRTQQMIRDAVAGVSAKLDSVRDETESGLSPVQSALANLAGRLEAIENGDASLTPPPVRPAPPRPAPREAARRDAPRPYRSSLPPAEEALASYGVEDTADGGAEVEPDEEIVIDPPARPNPFTAEGMDPLDAPTAPESSWRSDSDAIPMPPPEPAPEPVARPARAEEKAPRPLGATADSNFLAAARKSARTSGEASRKGGRASVLETRREERTGSGRRVLFLAGLLAIVTLGGAAYLLFLDGGPFSATGARLAGEIGDPEVTGVLNGGSAAEFSAVDGAQPDAVLGLPGAALAPADASLEEPASAPAATEAVTDATDAAAIDTAEGAAPETPAAPAGPVAETPAAPAAQTPARATPDESAAAADSRIVSAAPAQPAEATPPAAIVETPAPAAPQAAAPAPQAAAAAPAQQAAFEGDPAAQFQVGEMELQSGDPQEGARLVRSAANQGYPPAQYRLGKLYETGAAGVPQDDVQARMWTERAAVAGNRNAMHNLGLMYAEGRGVEQSDQQAAQWFERAALIGATDSQFNLAVLYEQGRGVPQSLPDAYAWYRIAERAGDREAGERANLLVAQIPQAAAAEAQRVADAFQPRASDPAANGAVTRTAQGAGQGAGQVTGQTSADAVQRAQQLLAGLGYTPGAADGAIGPETRLAIIQYQRDNGMAETGGVDAALLASLESAAAR